MKTDTFAPEIQHVKISTLICLVLGILLGVFCIWLKSIGLPGGAVLACVATAWVVGFICVRLFADSELTPEEREQLSKALHEHGEMLRDAHKAAVELERNSKDFLAVLKKQERRDEQPASSG